jgi:hypothetical protein
MPGYLNGAGSIGRKSYFRTLETLEILESIVTGSPGASGTWRYFYPFTDPGTTDLTVSGNASMPLGSITNNGRFIKTNSYNNNVIHPNVGLTAGAGQGMIRCAGSPQLQDSQLTWLISGHSWGPETQGFYSTWYRFSSELTVATNRAVGFCTLMALGLTNSTEIKWYSAGTANSGYLRIQQNGFGYGPQTPDIWAEPFLLTIICDANPPTGTTTSVLVNGVEHISYYQPGTVYPGILRPDGSHPGGHSSLQFGDLPNIPGSVAWGGYLMCATGVKTTPAQWVEIYNAGKDK